MPGFPRFRSAGVAMRGGIPVGAIEDRLTLDSVSLAGRRILVVEDSWHVAQALKSMLEGAGMKVAGPVATTAKADELVASDPPEMALIDLNLGGETSYELIDRLIARGVAVVIVSSYESPVALQSKVAAVMGKPVRSAALLERLREIASDGSNRAGH